MGRKRTGLDYLCPICGKTFYRPASQIRRQKEILTCSFACRGILKTDGERRNCKQCGKEFYLGKARAKRVAGLYCSNTCNGLAINKKTIIQCAWCKANLERAPWELRTKKRHFCNITCTHEWKRRYGTDRGRGAFTAKQKREWMEPCCRRCGSTKNLQLDHIIPKFAGGSNTRDNAQTLCRTCNKDKFWLEDQFKFSPDLPHSARLDCFSLTSGCHRSPGSQADKCRRRPLRPRRHLSS